MECAQRKMERGNKMDKKQYTLEELEQLLGKEQMDRLFLEHYLMLVGRDKVKIMVADDLKLKDIME